ncbi:MAG: hypothetical protein ABI818_09345 [Acidobacteriota bacterium]
MNAIDFTVSHPVPQAAEAGTRRAAAPWGFPEVFVISQTALPALLYLPGTQSFRVTLRFSAFAISLGAYVWWLTQSGVRPQGSRTESWVLAVMAVLGLSLFNPATTSLVGGLAHAMVYFAVMSPLFWAPSMVRTPEHLARLLGLVLICSGVNSIVGVLQVYDPGRWMPAELSRIITGAGGTGPITYVGNNGQVIIRPPGLFDTPGAVAGPGMFAALLGAIFGLSAIPLWQRAGAFAMSAAGIAAIYLSQVRVSLVVTVFMCGMYAFTLMTQKRVAKATTFGLLVGGLVTAAFIGAVTLGGKSITDRFMTLLGNDPYETYHHARGVQLDYTFTDMLYQYPLGAGLGRWGVAGAYFGTPGSTSLWAEIQITGWMIDGGVVMIFLYSGAIIVAALSQFRLARRTDYPRVAACAAVIFAANLGIAVMVISFTPFVTQIGIQYWFLAGALHGVASNYKLQDA